MVDAEVHSFLSEELNTPVLDELYERLWLVASMSGASIDPLHRQIVKGRNIVPSEDPKLHLVWHDDKIYLKPIPVCLLNHDFWTTFLPSSTEKSSPIVNRPPVSRKALGEFDRTAAVGFLRSYAFLIQHYLDFILARDHHLIPRDIDWIKWSTFIVHHRTRAQMEEPTGTAQ